MRSIYLSGKYCDSLPLVMKRIRFEDFDDRLIAWHLFQVGKKFIEAEMEAVYFGGPHGVKIFYSLN